MLLFLEVISASAPHIYASALPLSPQTSFIHKLYKQYACPSAKVVQGLPISWDPVLVTVRPHDFLMVAVWSPCSRFIAIARYRAIEILDAATLEQLWAFESPGVSSDQRLSFSPDSCTLFLFEDGELTSWDLQTGVPADTIIPAATRDMCFENPFSFAYSMDRKVLVASNAPSQDSAHIDTYDLISGTHICSCPAPEGQMVAPIWTHGECVYFVTVKQGSIIVWEAAFTSELTPVILKSLPTPDEITSVKGEDFLFLPALSQLAFTAQDTVFVWDAQDSRFLLKSGSIPNAYHTEFSRMSFSSDGHFFSYTTLDPSIYVWKRSPACYTLHQRLGLHPGLKGPLLSPDGESIISIHSSKVRLWHTRAQVLPSSSIPVHNNAGDFVLEFSPNKDLAAFARCWNNIVTILDLQSNGLRLIIDAGMEIQCPGVTGSTIAVASKEKIITWNIPAENYINARASIDDSIHAVMLEYSYPARQSIFPDLSRILSIELGNGLNIHIGDTSTGKCLTGIKIPYADGLITLDGSEVWVKDWEDYVRGWKVIEDSESSTTKLEFLETAICVPPWQSNCGYEVTTDGWVLSPTKKKRLIWLPHDWRPENLWHKSWSEQFLGLRHPELPEIIILEFLD